MNIIKGKFKKGDSRINRRGRPKRGNSVVEVLEGALYKTGKDGQSKLNLICDAFVDIACRKTDVRAKEKIFAILQRYEENRKQDEILKRIEVLEKFVKENGRGE